ncbi:hypothetical protein [Streptomyces sp. NPDC059176]|uniref:hypothetical protein n=1 Tax=unclassified Streptomyces TaxID=2593676 RepID=UPI0036871AF2
MASELSAREVALLDQLEAALRTTPPPVRPTRTRVALVAAVVAAAAAGVLFFLASLSGSSGVGCLAVALWATAVLLVSAHLGHGPSRSRWADCPEARSRR